MIIDGEVSRPKYFEEQGIAIHGYTSVPPYPASHGCVRVTLPAMDWLWHRTNCRRRPRSGCTEHSSWVAAGRPVGRGGGGDVGRVGAEGG
ncbi:MAG: L,D-transpeptidase [Micromonospora sp.]